MSVNILYKLGDISDVEATMNITMAVREWRNLKMTLGEWRGYGPQGELQNGIKDLLAQMEANWEWKPDDEPTPESDNV